MKLKLEIPEGYEIKGFDYPCVGDRILLPSGEPFEVDEYDQAYHCPAIILKEVWEPEAGCVYEFSDVDDFSTTTLGVYTYTKEVNAHNRTQYVTDKNIGWKYMRPFQGKLGK